MDITEYLIATADECALIAKTGRMLVERLDAVTGDQKDGTALAVLTTFRRRPSPVGESRTDCPIAFGKSC